MSLFTPLWILKMNVIVHVTAISCSHSVIRSVSFLSGWRWMPVDCSPEVPSLSYECQQNVSLSFGTRAFMSHPDDKLPSVRADYQVR